jgi:hypothetical protein
MLVYSEATSFGYLLLAILNADGRPGGSGLAMRRGHRPHQQGADRRHDHIPTPITIPTASPAAVAFLL